MEKVLPIVRNVIPRDRKRVLPELVGKTFGMLTILQHYSCKPLTGKTKYTVLARCVCGTEKIIDERSVRRGRVVSCGRCASKTHGMSKSKAYAIWRSMRARCNNPSHKAFHNYGGRGITVCERWLLFENFLSDMGEPPFKGASIERIDNNRGYFPDNCRWVNWVTQARNKRNNRWITIEGQTRTLAEWVSISGLKYNTVLYRIEHGWDIKDAITVPPNFANNMKGKNDC